MPLRLLDRVLLLLAALLLALLWGSRAPDEAGSGCGRGREKERKGGHTVGLTSSSSLSSLLAGSSGLDVSDVDIASGSSTLMFTPPASSSESERVTTSIPSSFTLVLIVGREV